MAMGVAAATATASATSVVFVLLTVLVHAQAIRFANNVFESMRRRREIRLAASMLLLIVAHVVEAIAFALGFYLQANVWGIGGLSGQFDGHFYEYIYYSMATYTTLGLGDIFPSHGLRLMTGIESVTGLLMITWSAAFSFVQMERLWLRGGE